MLKNFFAVFLIVLASLSSLRAQDRDPAQEPYDRARQRYLKQDFDGAIADYTRAIALSTHRAPKASDKLDFTAVESSSDSITLVSPLIASAYGGRALARYRKGDVDGAIADCDHALSLDSGLVEVYSNRATLRWAKGDLEGALADFGRFIKARPNEAQAYDSRGRVLLNKGDIAGALKNFEQAINLNPRKAEFYCSRGQARQALGDNEGGLADCDYAIKLNPRLASAFYCRGRARYVTDLNDALAAFRKSVELDPNLAEAHAGLGWVLLWLGRDAEAEKEFGECFRLDPSLKPTLERLRIEAMLKRPRN